MSDEHTGGGLSRRQFAKATIAGAVAAGVAGGEGATAIGAPRGGVRSGARRPRTEDLALVNGRFVTLGGRTSVSAVAIRDGRIAAVGSRRSIGRAARTVDLGGRTVVPGLIDSHQHFIRAIQNPGHEVRDIETAASVVELLDAIRRRAATVPAGRFLTLIGGWNRNGLAEARLPTPEELGAAAPAHPVYLSETGGGGQAVTNALGAAFFAAAGVAVDPATGTLTPAAGRAALVAVQTAEDKRRSTAEGLAYAASLGLTAVYDQGGVPLEDYEHPLALARTGEIPVRLRIFLSGVEFPTVEGIKERVRNSFNRIGDEHFRTVGVGERLSANPTPADIADLLDFLGARGWTLSLHSLSRAENATHVAAFRAAAETYPIAALRWQLHHLNDATDAVLAEIKALGTPVGLQSWRYTSTAGGTPFRRVVDLGIPAGGGTDGTNVAPMSPWLALYHMVTGRNNAGTPINPGEQISRDEALRLYTVGSAYLAFDEDDYGSIEPGKMADLAVLDGDYLTVPDERIKTLRSVLTLQGGRAVHAAPRFARLRD